MEAITIRLDESTLKSLDTEADEHERSRSEHIRELLRARTDHDQQTAEYEERIAECEHRIEELERENERLHRERRQLLEQRDEHTDLVEYVEEERSLTKRRAQAGVLTRAKWWLTGMPTDDDNSNG